MSDEIPFHIQEEIMKRLPVVSLLQFRSVSKAWKSLIESSDFIASHSVTQPQHLLLRYKDLVETTEKYVCVADDDTFPHQQRYVHTHPLSVKPLKHSFLVGISHGLLCFHGYDGDGEDFSPNLETEILVLWNPSIRKSITVHVPNESNTDHNTQLGFGVCPVSGDPKIVQITQFINQTSYHCESQVYKVSSGKWTSLSTHLPSKPFHVFWPQVVVDRFIYWCAYDLTTMDSRFTNENLIMSFDITNENFRAVDLPDSLRQQAPSQLCISKLKESLVMLEYDSFQKRACGVWMMENGVENSFTKLFNFVAPDWLRTMTILGFRKTGQPLMEVEYADGSVQHGELVVYEPKSERFNYLDIYRKPKTFFVNSYMETLVLLDRSDCNVYPTTNDI